MDIKTDDDRDYLRALIEYLYAAGMTIAQLAYVTDLPFNEIDYIVHHAPPRTIH